MWLSAISGIGGTSSYSFAESAGSTTPSAAWRPQPPASLHSSPMAVLYFTPALRGLQTRAAHVVGARSCRRAGLPRFREVCLYGRPQPMCRPGGSPRLSADSRVACHVSAPYRQRGGALTRLLWQRQVRSLSNPSVHVSAPMKSSVPLPRRLHHHDASNSPESSRRMLSNF